MTRVGRRKLYLVHRMQERHGGVDSEVEHSGSHSAAAAHILIFLFLGILGLKKKLNGLIEI